MPEHASSPRVLVITPTYDEAGSLADTVAAILTAAPEVDVLVVDDASPDGTGAIADALAAADPRVSVLHRTGRRGLGVAYIEAMRFALRNTDADVICQMDADLSHRPVDLARMLKALTGADLVIGSRYREKRVTVVNWPIGRLLLSYFANVYARFVTGLQIFDTTAGYKVFRRKVLEAIDLNDVRSNGYAFQIEMHFRTWKKGFRMVEIPIVFVDRTEGTSKMSKKIVREAVWMVWRLRWWAITGRV